jgi:hypothetical protein
MGFQILREVLFYKYFTLTGLKNFTANVSQPTLNKLRLPAFGMVKKFI